MEEVFYIFIELIQNTSMRAFDLQQEQNVLKFIVMPEYKPILKMLPKLAKH